MDKLTYFSGTSGLVLPVKNKSFYPAAFRDQSRLSYYGSLFDSIEINSSFYKIPKAATVRKWSESVPDQFRFTFKLWKEITHVKGLVFDPEMVKAFMNVIDEAGQKKGCLLVQFPPGLKVSAFGQLRKLIETIRSNDRENTWSISVEFRDKSWYRDETFQLLNELQAGMVIHDKTGSQTPSEEMDAGFIYLRFHGPGGNYRGSYDDAFLHEYATYIKDWIDEGKEVYTYFNNTMGEAISNLKTLNAALEILFK